MNNQQHQFKPPPKEYFNDVFLPKLNNALIFEKQAQERIIKYYNNEYSLLNECKNSNYDFELSNNIKYEVKTDFKAVKTTNFFIEYIQFNRPSGIQTTKANFYIIIIPFITKTKYYLIETLELEFFILTKQFKYIVEPTEHNNFTGGYIFSVDIIIKSSIEI